MSEQYDAIIGVLGDPGGVALQIELLMFGRMLDGIAPPAPSPPSEVQPTEQTEPACTPRKTKKTTRDTPTGQRRLNDRQRELLAYVQVRDNTAYFAKDERIPDWKRLKYVLTTLGGTWKGGKTQGFLFPIEIDAAKKVRVAQETGEITDPKRMGFYPTPNELADWMVEVAEIQPNMHVLEPSAGTGSIVKAIQRAQIPGLYVVAVELLRENYLKLCDIVGIGVSPDDFLRMTPDTKPPTYVDRILMNPPFSTPGPLSDTDHVLHAIKFLKPRGRLVSIMGAGAYTNTTAKAEAFHAEIRKYKHQWYENPEGSFVSSGTAVRTMTLVLDNVRV